MNSKNILVAIGVLGIGVILYKFLIGFVLPVALFVSLGYILKFLLKGSESDSGDELSQILKNSEPSSSTDNIVEIKPIEENKPSSEDIPSEENKPFPIDTLSEEDAPSESNKLSTGDSSSKTNVPSADDKSNEEANIS